MSILNLKTTTLCGQSHKQQIPKPSDKLGENISIYITDKELISPKYEELLKLREKNHFNEQNICPKEFVNGPEIYKKMFSFSQNKRKNLNIRDTVFTYQNRKKN